MFRRGRKKKEETSGSTTSSPRADTEDSKHSGNSLHKSIFAFHSSSKEKSTTSVDSGQGSGVAEKQAPAISSDEPATLPEATSLQPPGGHNPELLRNSNKSNGQSSVDGDEPLVIRGTDVQHSTSEQARGSRADTPPLKKQVITPADAPRFIRPISGVWDEAYKCLYDKNPDLIKEYQKCLLTQSDGTTLAVSAQTTATAFFGMGKVDLHRQMLRVIQLRTEGNEAKRWKLNFLGHELAVKNLVKPVVGIIEPAKDYVGAALDSSAIGSAAWAGVCLLLPVRTPSLFRSYQH
jgi:hypothetical protein